MGSGVQEIDKDERCSHWESESTERERNAHADEDIVARVPQEHIDEALKKIHLLSESPEAALKEDDLHTWLLGQAAALRRQEYNNVDWKNLAEELEAMAAALENKLKSQLQRLLLHLLKWAAQPRRRSASWQISINNARDEIQDVLEEAPGLKSKIEKLLPKTYQRARRDVALILHCPEKELPDSCPWTYDEFVKPSFLPDQLPQRPKNGRRK